MTLLESRANTEAEGARKTNREDSKVEGRPHPSSPPTYYLGPSTLLF